MYLDSSNSSTFTLRIRQPTRNWNLVQLEDGGPWLHLQHLSDEQLRQAHLRYRRKHVQGEKIDGRSMHPFLSHMLVEARMRRLLLPGMIRERAFYDEEPGDEYFNEPFWEEWAGDEEFWIEP